MLTKPKKDLNVLKKVRTREFEVRVNQATKAFMQGLDQLLQEEKRPARKVQVFRSKKEWTTWINPEVQASR